MSKIWSHWYFNAQEVTDHTLLISFEHLHLLYLSVWLFAALSQMVSAGSKASNQWGRKLILTLCWSAPLHYEIVSHEGTRRIIRPFLCILMLSLVSALTNSVISITVYFCIIQCNWQCQKLALSKWNATQNLL